MGLLGTVRNTNKSPKKILFYSISFIVIILGIEFLLFLFFSIQNQKIISSQELFLKHNIKITKEFMNSKYKDCEYPKSFFRPDPFLGFTYYDSKECHKIMQMNINKQGFADKRDFPDNKDESFYDIFVLGGSVASFMTNYSSNGVLYFEDYLNRNFISPSGKPFRVFNGAIISQAQPSQLINLNLNGDFADLVISLDGFNEYLIMDNLKLSGPSTLFFEINNQITNLDFFSFFKMKLRSCISKSNIMINSFSFYTIYSVVDILSDNSNHQDYKDAVLKSFQRESSSIESDIKKYASFIIKMNTVIKENNSKFIQVYQPVPQLFKELTEKEKVNIKTPDLGITLDGKKYLELISNVDEIISKNNITSISLLKLLENNKETYYVDSIHFNYNPKHLDSVANGQKLMIEKLSLEISKELSLQKKN